MTGLQNQTEPRQVKARSQMEKKPEEGLPLKSTFLHVMLMAAVLIVSWVGVFVLYLARS